MNSDPARNFEAEAQPAANTDQPCFLWCLRTMHRHCKSFAGPIALVLLAVLVESCFIGALPLGFKHLVDEAAAGRARQAISTLSWVLGIGMMLASLAGLIRNHIYAKAVAGIVSDLRDRMFLHLQSLSLGYFQRTRPGETTTRFSSDVGVIENALSTVMPLVITPGLDLLVSVVLLFWLDWRLALLSMLIWPLAFAGPRLVMPRALGATSRKVELEAHLLQWVQETIAGQTVVKSLDLSEQMSAQFQRRNAALRSGVFHLNRASGLVEKTSVIGIWALQVLVLLVGGWMVHRGWLTIGALGAFQALFMTVANSLYYLSQYAPILIQLGGALKHLDGLLGLRPDLTDPAGAAQLGSFQRSIELCDASFSYTGERLNLQGVSLAIPRGSSVALVGASGSGKSTLASLLLRLFDPIRGGVKVDGHDLTTVTQRSWRRQVGVVSQDNFLFNLSLRENIRLGNPSATDEQIVAAAKLAEIHDTIANLPQGYDTPAGERGANLSGGQRQRVAIARALISNPAVLVLDEATSALDPATEARVNRTLRKIGAGRTVISVTHRLASVAHFDQICVFDQGRLIEQGSHADLVAAQSAYAKLWKEQNPAATTTDRKTSKAFPCKRRSLADSKYSSRRASVVTVPSDSACPEAMAA